jgi:hypothetical protein
MNTIAETIPTAFSAETSFTVTLAASKERKQANETPLPRPFPLPPEDRFIRRGVPESALHD